MGKKKSKYSSWFKGAPKPKSKNQAQHKRYQQTEIKQHLSRKATAKQAFRSAKHYSAVTKEMKKGDKKMGRRNNYHTRLFAWTSKKMYAIGKGKQKYANRFRRKKKN